MGVMRNRLEKYEGFVNSETGLILIALIGGLLFVIYALNHTRTDGKDADKRIDLFDWLGLNGSFVTERYRPMGRAVAVIAVVMCVVLAILGVLAMTGLWFALWDVVNPLSERAKADKSPGDSARGIAFVLGAIFGLPFLVWRSLVAQKQTNVSEQSHITERISKAVEQLGAEKEESIIGRPVTVWAGEAQDRTVVFGGDGDFTLPERAIEVSRTAETKPEYIPEEDTVEDTTIVHLIFRQWPREETRIEERGKPQPWDETEHVAEYGDWQGFKQTHPNIEVRIGGIYALERIAQDSLRDHVQIMEILTAYVRENAPASGAVELPQSPAYPEEYSSEAHGEWNRAFNTWRSELDEALQDIAPRTDIQTAMNVIGRRSAAQIKAEAEDTRHHKNGYVLDLRATNQQGIDLRGLYFNAANFTDAALQGADLSGAKLKGAYLYRAKLQGGKPPEDEVAGGRRQRGGVAGGSPQRGEVAGGRPQRGGVAGGKPQRGGVAGGKPQRGGVGFFNGLDRKHLSIPCGQGRRFYPYHKFKTKSGGRDVRGCDDYPA